MELTTHAGHFLGRATNRVLVYTDSTGAWVRAAGTWDPLDWPLDRLYVRLGRHSQHAFWGMGRPEESMLHQLAGAVRAHGDRRAGRSAAADGSADVATRRDS